MESTIDDHVAGPDRVAPTAERAKRDRSDGSKPQLSLVLEFTEALEGAAKGLAEGVAKYGRGNWKKGFPQEEIIDSLMSHLTKHMAGEIVDPDSSTGATHLDKLLCNALLLRQLHGE
ncbi:hypothetical protein D3C76_163710 [compost metagenome]